MRKLIPLLALGLVMVSGCSSGEKSTSDAPTVIVKLSKSETCREMYRLIGKTSDQLIAQSSGKVNSLFETALEFQNLASETKDEDLGVTLVSISQALKKMSNESTYFEGQMSYLTELSSLTQKCL
jgi:hypothetical protein